MKKCPFCCGDIEETARKCKYCTEWVDEKKEKSAIDSIKNNSTAEEKGNGTKEFQSLRQSHSKLRGLVANRLGDGYWGIEIRGDFPTHEEMVFLFSKIHSALGFEIIKIVRTEYPDCEAIKDGNAVTIEFEPKLSSFDHQNEKEQCNFIICWEDDLEDYNPIKEHIRRHNIEVISLKDMWEKFKTKEKLPKRTVWTERDIRKLSELQVDILSAFILTNKKSMTKEEIQEISKQRGKSTGGALAGLTSDTQKLYPILKIVFNNYVLEDRCRPLLTKVLKEYKKIQ